MTSLECPQCKAWRESTVSAWAHYRRAQADAFVLGLAVGALAALILAFIIRMAW